MLVHLFEGRNDFGAVRKLCVETLRPPQTRSHAGAPV
jgi:hypothetical protein